MASISTWLAPGGLLAVSTDGYSWQSAFRDPMIWAIALGAVSLIALIPRNTRLSRGVGVVSGAIALGLFLLQMPIEATVAGRLVFWICATVTLVSAVATISARNPVYSAIWFAVTLVGVSGLLLLQGAQFLGLATIVVYAGAIVVTFLFVIMLAKPDGDSTYDRITWGRLPRFMAVAAAALLVGVLTFAIGRQDDDPKSIVNQLVGDSAEAPWSGDEIARVRISNIVSIRLRSDADDASVAWAERFLPDLVQQHQPWHDKRVYVRRLTNREDVLDTDHVAHLGAQLFGRHLLSVELAGTLLLVALVGAVSIVIQGRNAVSAEERATS